MARLLFLLIAIALVLLVLKRLTAMRGPRASVDDHASRATKPDFEKTRRCVRCGAFIPSSLGRSTDAGYICSPDCRAQSSDTAHRP